MTEKPKVRYVKPDPLKDPWEKLRKKPGVRIISTAKRDS